MAHAPIGLGATAPEPSLHPPEELVLDYANRATSPAEAMMIGAHLRLCSACRRLVRSLDQIGGAMLSAIEPAHLPPNMLNRVLAAIESGAQPAQSGSVARPAPFDVDKALAAGRWRRIPGGLRMRRVDGGKPDAQDGHVWLLDGPPDMQMLPHRHTSEEWTLVLRGELIDDAGAYHAGDFILAKGGVDHRPRTGPGERCVSLLMVRQSPRYTTPMGRLAAPFIRL
jgi:putative transcriptional regulator